MVAGYALAATIRDGALGSVDVELRRWTSRVAVPLSARRWANRTAAQRCARFDGREVIVVGNAPTVRNLGATIDAVDVVVRVNPAGARAAQHAYVHRGRRAHVLHVNGNHPTSRVSAIFARFPASACVWTRSRAESAVQLGLPFSDGRLAEYDARRMAREHLELRECGSGRFLTAGMLAVLQVLAQGARRPVRLAGVTAFAAPGHAYTNSSWQFHQHQLARHHCIDVERKLLRRLVREGAAQIVCEAAALFDGAHGRAAPPRARGRGLGRLRTQRRARPGARGATVDVRRQRLHSAR